MTNDRLRYIDALRGFAILGVIIAHAASLTDLQRPYSFVSKGGFGVQLFFVVSAFTIFLTYDRAKACEESPVRNFFIRRLFRIVPLYWLGIILYTAVYGLGSRGWRPGPELWHFPYHITFTNDLHPLTSSSVVPGGWSISVEVLFYLTVPLWFFLVRNVRTAAIFAIVSIIGSLAGTWALQQTLSFPGVPQGEMDNYWHRLFPSQLPVFAFGMLLYYLVKEGKAVWLAAPRWNIAFLAGAAFLFLFGSVFEYPIPQHIYYAASFMMVGLALSQIPWKIAVNAFTVFVGRASYSGYLIHFLVLKQLSLLIPQGGMATPVYFVLILALGLAVTLPLSHLSFRYIETAFTRLGRRLIKQLEGSPGVNPLLTKDAAGL